MRTFTAAQTQLLALSDRKTAFRMRMRDATAAATIAAGSSGASLPVTTLHVASVPANTPSQGTGICQLNTGGYAVFTWTGITSNTYTGVAWGQATGTLATTGGTVASTPDYSSIGNTGQSDWCVGVEWSESIDSLVATATVQLARSNFAQNLSHLMINSVWNAGGKSIAKHREMWIEIAVLPMNQPAPAATDWIMMFHGFSDKLDVGKNPITITCTDLGGELAKTQIEVQRNYGVWAPGQIAIVGYRVVDPLQQNATPPAAGLLYWWECTTAGKTQGAVWAQGTYGSAASTGKARGDCVCPTVTNGQLPQQFWECTTAGTTGSTEPNWLPTPNPYSSTTVTDGSVVWTLIDSSNDAYPQLLSAQSPPPTLTDGTTVAEQGTSTLVWTARVPGTRLASTSYALNKVLYKTASNLTFYWVCTTSGTTASGGGPTYPTNPTLGQTVTDGTAVFSLMPCPGGNLAETILQMLLNDNNQRISATLVTNPPAGKPNTGKYLGPYTQSASDKVLPALNAIALELGYDLRYSWNSSIGDFSLTLNYINRANTTPVATWKPTDYNDIGAVTDDIQDIINAVGITYTDLSLQTGSYSDLVLGNVPIRKKIIVTDATSISNNGRLYADIIEGASLSTNDPVSAALFGSTVIADLKGDFIEQSPTGPLKPELQLNDMLTLAANGVHYDSDQTQAVVTISHKMSPTESSTTLGMRGVQTAGYAKYHEGVIAAGNAWTPALSVPPPAGNVVVTPHINAAWVTFDPPLHPRYGWDHSEVHISTVSGFTPIASTMVGRAYSGSHHVTGLTPGTTYYCRVVHRSKKHNQVTASKQVSFTVNANLLVNVDLTIRQNLFTYVAADANGGAGAAGVPSGWIPFVNNHDNTYGLVGYDPAGVWDNTHGRWRPGVPGKYVLDYQVEATGMHQGAVMQVVVVAVTLNVGPTQSTLDCTPIVQAISNQTTGTVRALCLGQTTLQITSTMITNGYVVYWLGYIDDSSTLLFKAPTSGTWGGVGNDIFKGCQLKITQDLA